MQLKCDRPQTSLSAGNDTCARFMSPWAALEQSHTRHANTFPHSALPSAPQTISANKRLLLRQPPHAQKAAAVPAGRTTSHSARRQQRPAFEPADVLLDKLNLFLFTRQMSAPEANSMHRSKPQWTAMDRTRTARPHARTPHTRTPAHPHTAGATAQGSRLKEQPLLLLHISRIL
jgi:hypothetical protein